MKHLKFPALPVGDARNTVNDHLKSHVRRRNLAVWRSAATFVNDGARVLTLRSGPSSGRPTPARPISRSSACAPIPRASSASRCGCSRARSTSGWSPQGREAGRAADRRGADRPAATRAMSCATAESMPVRTGRDDRPSEGPFPEQFAFAAIDEAQLGIDPERGHVFTDRMLRARGREETLILGSDTLKPIDPRACCPKRRSSAARASRPCATPATSSCRACRRAPPSSLSPPSRFTRSPRCCAGSAAARRW